MSGYFSFVCLIQKKVQWFSACVNAFGVFCVCVCKPLSESDRLRERKRENGLDNECVLSERCSYQFSTGRLQQMSQKE